ncbi:type II secretion system protein GspD [Winogradskyella flava]|uniref:General secretion pathway protein GspD n=1 Tax=Winogradskyella flava TaxID=1884876 RepID=A0A842IQZ4_9FLAO|nr:general secretion pathway protein GspD [Winogradskyella flava]MBC2844619.1 general secretion pathway protein GspD [Winogradskyella flava]
MKLLLRLVFGLCIVSVCYSQDDQRLIHIDQQLKQLSVDNIGLTENLDASISLNDVTLPNFLLAVSSVHDVNINVSPELNSINIKNNFSSVTVSDMLLFLCKEYSLTIEFTKNILSVKPYVKQTIEDIYPLKIDFDPIDETISLDVRNNKLYEVFKEIMDKSAKNLLYAPDMEHMEITAYIKPTDFDTAMDKMALTNNLILTKTKDNFYVFDKILSNDQNNNSLSNRMSPNLSFKVKDSILQRLEVDFKNAPVSDIVESIGAALGINIFMASPLDAAGNATLNAKSISFDTLLVKLFEQQAVNFQNDSKGSAQNRNNASLPSDRFTFKKEDDIYFFGTEKQLSVRKVEIIRLKHRSVNMMADPQNMTQGNDIRGNYQVAEQGFRNQLNNGFNNNNLNTANTRPQNRNYTTNSNTFTDNQNAKSILDLIPEEVTEGLDCKIDVELNSIYVTGTGAKIEYFKTFIKNIDKAIPVILIEVMIVEAQVSNTIEAGVSWGIGNEPTTTQGNLYPTADINVGAETINRIISGFSSTSVFNFGRVVPNFFATVKAMETNGDLKIKSTPKLATLNGHRASFSNGQTSYYAVVQRNIIGTDNPQTSEIRNYFPIDAKLGLDIKPYVTGDKQVLLDINVIQSSFGQRIAEDAPPDISSRNFSSVVRMKDQDIAVLGGLEENYSNNSGSGVPFLARIPLIKWLFSKRVREGRKSKLTVFIKPTVIY